MKNRLTRIFWPILRFFETDDDPASYKKSHRVALNGVGGLFIFLSLVSAVTAYSTGGVGSFIPMIIFFCAGLVAVVVGSLGSNSAVSKIWGTK
jgi:UDP-N-acetylmuramyl pentapeptide phosphotransferase/UDP-N-acetylglucosamine-1-phosphate transferase